MHLAVGEGFGSIDGDVAVVHPELASYENRRRATESSVYGGVRRRPNWVAILLIIAIHAGGLMMLATLNIIAVPKLKIDPMVVTLIPDLAPPPPSKPKPIPVVLPPPTVLDVPPPVVALNLPTPNIVPTPAPTPQAQPTPAPAPAKTVSVDLDAATVAGTPPAYPIESRRRHEQGTVKLRVVIGTDGRVKDISIASSSGFERLDKAALDAVRRWRFQPQMQAGVAVEAVGTLPIPFRLA